MSNIEEIEAQLEQAAEHRREEFLTSGWRAALELLLATFETMLSHAKKLHGMHELSLESMKDIETKLQDIFSHLGKATVYVGLDLRDPKNSQYPLRLLWDRWEACKKRVEEMVEWFLEK